MRLSLFALLAVLPYVAYAQTPARYVIDIDQNKVFVDFNKQDGAQVGMKLRVFQPTQKKHPITGALLRDELEVGVLTLLEVGDSISLGRFEQTGASALAVGAMLEPLASAPSSDQKPPVERPSPGGLGQHFPLSYVDAFEPVEIDATFAGPVSRVLLLYRRTGEGKNTMLAMDATTSGRYTAEIPPEAVDAPSLEYQISFLDADGIERTLPANGAQYKVSVKPRGFSETLDLKELRGKTSELTLSFQTVNFGGSRGGYLGSAVDYHHRIFNTFYGIRMGAGFLRGQTPNGAGAFVENNFVFGLAEVELRLRRYLSLLPQATFGVEQDGFSTGGQVRLRIGREVGYNLVLGASGILGLGGQLLSVNLNAPASKAVTLGGEIQVSTLFNPGTPSLILTFNPRIRLSDGLGLIGCFGVAAQDSSGVGFSGSLSASYFF